MDDFIMQIIGELGRHPDVIRHAITASNEEKHKSLRPLKAKLAQFQCRHKELGEELQRYLVLARQPGAGHFGQETLAAAEDLAKLKHELEREIEKVKIDIAHRERVVTDEQIISDALLAFAGRMSGLPFDDQRDLLHLMMRQIRVNRLDPEKDRIPAGPHGWDTKIRTQWFVVNLEIYASDLFSISYKNPAAGSHLDHDGGGGGIRTHGTFRFSGFQDRRNRPLYHPSNGICFGKNRCVKY